MGRLRVGMGNGPLLRLGPWSNVKEIMDGAVECSFPGPRNLKNYCPETRKFTNVNSDRPGDSN